MRPSPGTVSQFLCFCALSDIWTGSDFQSASVQVKGFLKQLMGSVHSSVTAACDEYFDRYS